MSGYTELYGGSGDHTVAVGGTYSETHTVVNGGTGLDTIRGASSSDTIYAQDGEKDDTACGAGDDTVFFDEGIDGVNPVNCETLNPPKE